MKIIFKYFNIIFQLSLKKNYFLLIMILNDQLNLKILLENNNFFT